MSELFEFNNKKIVVTQSNIHFCEPDDLLIFSLQREGFTLSNLLSKIIYLTLTLFSTPKIRSVPIVAKTFDLEDKFGRLHFNWKRYIRTKSLPNVSELD